MSESIYTAIATIALAILENIMGGQSTKVVEVIRTVIRDLNKEKFERNQIEFQEFCSKIKISEFCPVAVGNVGSGKSTALKLFYKVKAEAGGNASDGTLEFTTVEDDQKNKFIDTVGFTPSIENLSRMYICLMFKGVLPKFLIYPNATGRMREIGDLAFFLKSGLATVRFICFNPGVYYKLLKRGIPEHECIQDSIMDEQEKEIQQAIKINGLKHELSTQSDTNLYNMGQTFMDLLFEQIKIDFNTSDKRFLLKYKPISYEAHKQKLESLDPVEYFRFRLVSSMDDLNKCWRMKDETKIINEMEFLKYR
jgi:hypothetical protein